MVAALTTATVGGGGPPPGRIGGGWLALTICSPSAAAPMPGHLAKVSRFSKMTGRSFLPRHCRGNLLYVSDTPPPVC
jgi:hypothetical protein